MLEIRQTENKGRGVFSTTNIKRGDLIEMSPVIVLTLEEKDVICQTVLSEYFFEWGKEGAIGLGFTSLYNHSDTPNAEYLPVMSERSIIINAIKDIPAGEEICINYKTLLQFTPK